jgi:hypothetical protein
LAETTIINALEDHNSTNPLIYEIYHNYYSAKEKGILINSYLADYRNEIYGNSVKELAKSAANSHVSVTYDLVTQTYSI